MKFAVPQRQSLASGYATRFQRRAVSKKASLTKTPLTLFAPAPSPVCVPGTCAVNALLFSVVLRNSVQERGLWCTEYAFGAKKGLLVYARRFIKGTRCKKQASTVPNGNSVLKKASWGTRCVFKGPQNSRLHRLWTGSCGTECVFRGPRCMKTPSCRTRRIFSARNGLRSEAGKHKRGRQKVFCSPSRHFQGIHPLLIYGMSFTLRPIRP